MFDRFIYQSNDNFLFILKVLVKRSFADVGLFGNFFDRCSVDALSAKNIQSCFFQLLPGSSGPFLRPVFFGFFCFGCYNFDYLVKTDQMFKKKFDFCKNILIFI